MTTKSRHNIKVAFQKELFNTQICPVCYNALSSEDMIHIHASDDLAKQIKYKTICRECWEKLKWP